MYQKIKSIDLFVVVLIMMVWGINNVAVKYILGELSPFLFLGLRFFILSAVLSVLYFPDAKHFRAILFVTLFLGLGHFGMWVFGAQGVDAATAAITAQLSVPFGVLLAYIVLKEKINFMKIVGIAIAFWGVVVIAGEPRVGKLIFLMLIVGSAFFSAVNNVFLNREKNIKKIDYNFMSLITGMSILVTPVFVACSLLYENNQIEQISQLSPKGWGVFLYTVFATTVFGYVAWMRIISKYEVSRICYYPLLQPFFALIFGWWFLDESISKFKLIGGALIILGILIIHLKSFPFSTKLMSFSFLPKHIKTTR